MLRVVLNFIQSQKMSFMKSPFFSLSKVGRYAIGIHIFMFGRYSVFFFPHKAIICSPFSDSHVCYGFWRGLGKKSGSFNIFEQILKILLNIEFQNYFYACFNSQISSVLSLVCITVDLFSPFLIERV